MLKASVALYFSGSRVLMVGPLLALSEFELTLAALVGEFVFAFAFAFPFAFESDIGRQALIENKSRAASASNNAGVFRKPRILSIVDLCCPGPLWGRYIRRSEGGSKTKDNMRVTSEEKPVTQSVLG
jgi:hypothetical protein